VSISATAPGEIEESSDAAEEKRKLQKHFGRFDLFFFLICTLVGLDTIGSVAKSGAQGFTWLAFLAVFFFVPYALLTAELGSTFPEEGGPYIWTRMAFGRFAGAISVVMYWLSNPIWIGGTLTITAATAVSTFVHPVSDPVKYAICLLFIWFTVASAVLSLRVGKWVSTIGAWARVGVLSLFTGSVILYAIKNGIHGVVTRDFSPTFATFIAVVPVLIFNYVGFELPSSAGEEMRNPQRDVPFAVARSAVGAVLLYGIPILCVLLVLPQKQLTSLSGFLDAIKAVFTVYGGSIATDGTIRLTGLGSVMGGVAAFGFFFATAASGATWLMGADRALAVAAYDGAGPRILGRFSARFGTPVIANVLSGVLSTVVMVLAFMLSQGDSNKYFAAVLGLAISTTMISYLFLFPAVIKLRYTHGQSDRPYRVPWGMKGVWMCGVAATFWALLATVGLLWPGLGVNWFGAMGKPDESLPAGFGGERLEYELTQILPLFLFLGLGAMFYVMGRPTRMRMRTEGVIL